mgnify:FL=1
MSFDIKSTDKFAKSFKKLAKKYKNFKKDYKYLLETLKANNHTAVQVTGDIYKIRLQNSSNPKGKSGGFRVVYFLKTEENTIYLLDIFSKNEMDNIKKHKLIEMQNTCNIQ